MRPLINVLFLCLLCSSCKSQGQELNQYIPEGYVQYDSMYGDLNNDGLEDWILVVKATDTSEVVLNRFEKMVDRNRRGMVVLLRTQSGYNISHTNYNCFSSENEDGYGYYPPQLNINIDKGNLIVHYEHGKYGFWSYTFRLMESSFDLIQYDHLSRVGPVVEVETSIDFLKKEKRTRTNMTPDEEGNNADFKEEKTTIETQSLIKLNDIRDFDELNFK